jgi:hypothetical protein
MSDENLGEVLDEGYKAYHREVAIRNLGTRTHLTLEKLAKLVAHKEHGETVKDITLQELIDVQMKTGTKSAPRTPPSSAKKTSKKPTATAKAPKPAPAKKIAKKPTAAKKPAPVAKKTAKKTAKMAPSDKGPKADKGKPKPRLDYETGTREVLAAVKAASGPVGRGEIEEATGYSGVQVRTFAKKLAAAGKLKVLGKGGRSTRYDAS